MSGWFTSIGVLFGWLSGLFLLYDRYAKGRPTASFAVKDKKGCIRITNIGDYDIAVIDACVKPEVYFLTEDMETRTLLEGAAGRRPTFMLKPREDKELFIAPLYKDGIQRDLEDQKVTFRISWRRGNVTWLPQMPVYVRTSTSTIRQYAEALRPPP
jgi:hypothetical protein